MKIIKQFISWLFHTREQGLTQEIQELRRELAQLTKENSKMRHDLVNEKTAVKLMRLANDRLTARSTLNPDRVISNG